MNSKLSLSFILFLRNIKNSAPTTPQLTNWNSKDGKHCIVLNVLVTHISLPLYSDPRRIFPRELISTADLKNQLGRIFEVSQKRSSPHDFLSNRIPRITK